MEKGIALVFKYSDSSGFGVARVYTKDTKELAEFDLNLMRLYASLDRSWELVEIDISVKP